MIQNVNVSDRWFWLVDLLLCWKWRTYTSKKVLMDEKWSHEKHKTNDVFEPLNFFYVQAFYFDGMFASQVNTNNVFDKKCWPLFFANCCK